MSFYNYIYIKLQSNTISNKNSNITSYVIDIIGSVTGNITDDIIGSTIVGITDGITHSTIGGIIFWVA